MEAEPAQKSYRAGDSCPLVPKIEQMVAMTKERINLGVEGSRQVTKQGL